MTTHRIYHFTCPSEELNLIGQFLEGRCKLYWWYNDPYAKAAKVGTEFGFKVSARDQWRCHQRAIHLALELCEVLQLSPDDMSVPLWTTPDPHSNRGYSRVPSR